MDHSMRGDDEIAVLTKHNSCKGLYTGMVRGCLQTLLIIFLVWQEYDQRSSRKPIAFSPWVRRAIFSCMKNNSLLSTHLCG